MDADERNKALNSQQAASEAKILELNCLSESLKTSTTDLQGYCATDVMSILQENEALRAMYKELLKTTPVQHNKLKEGFWQLHQNYNNVKEYTRQLEETIQDLEQNYQRVLRLHPEAVATVAVQPQHTKESLSGQPVRSSSTSARILYAILDQSHSQIKGYAAEHHELQVHRQQSSKGNNLLLPFAYHA